MNTGGEHEEYICVDGSTVRAKDVVEIDYHPVGSRELMQPLSSPMRARKESTAYVKTTSGFTKQLNGTEADALKKAVIDTPFTNARVGIRPVVLTEGSVE